MRFGSVDVVVSGELPMTPSGGENIVRSVRHGLADVLAWLGEDVGPRPGEQTHCILAGGVLFVSKLMFEQIKQHAEMLAA